MPLITASGGFILLVLVLSTLRTSLVRELSITSLLIFGSTKPGLLLYSLFFLPGTIIHELSHWLVAEILQVRTGAITILPDLESTGEDSRLGSVATVQTDPFRSFLIGIAPFITGLFILTVLGSLLFEGWGVYPLYQLILIIYGIMVIGNSMMTSKADRRSWPVIIFLFLLLVVVLWRSNLALPATLSHQAVNIFQSLNLVLGVTTAINLVMIGGSFSVRRLIERLTHKRILFKK